MGQAYIYDTSDIKLLNRCYLQLKVYLCLVEIPGFLVILKSSWQISSWPQGASGNQSTLPNVFTKHTSSATKSSIVIQHLATKSPTNPPPRSFTSSTVAEAASGAGTVSSCDFASFGRRFGKGKRSANNWVQEGFPKEKNINKCWAHICQILLVYFFW